MTAAALILAVFCLTTGAAFYLGWLAGEASCPSVIVATHSDSARARILFATQHVSGGQRFSEDGR